MWTLILFEAATRRPLALRVINAQQERWGIVKQFTSASRGDYE